MNKKKILILLATILVAGLAIWRLWPCALAGHLGDVSQVIRIDGALTISGIKTETAPLSSNLYMDTYALTVTEDNHTLQAVLEILAQASVRNDFRNLLPWTLPSVGSDSDHDGRSITLALQWEDDAHCSLSFLDPTTVAVGLDDGFSVYHFTSTIPFETLATLMMAEGTKSS
ncbi:hypothetical protein RFF05_18100 [Bengtsoniella intestinalis]|uniref:hypothetical protein n=1 Tax=Bengtsoniella intestinalis TaxID=3073143 RepID=UPI00391F69A0